MLVSDDPLVFFHLIPNRGDAGYHQFADSILSETYMLEDDHGLVAFLACSKMTQFIVVSHVLNSRFPSLERMAMAV
jgi:hypothetical protein